MNVHLHKQVFHFKNLTSLTTPLWGRGPETKFQHCSEGGTEPSPRYSLLNVEEACGDEGTHEKHNKCFVWTLQGPLPEPPSTEHQIME